MEPGPPRAIATAGELYGELGLPTQYWRLERLDSPSREATGPGGQVAPVTDTVVIARRHPAP